MTSEKINKNDNPCGHKDESKSDAVDFDNAETGEIKIELVASNIDGEKSEDMSISVESHRPNDKSEETKVEKDIDLVCKNTKLDNKLHPEKLAQGECKECVKQDNLPGLFRKPSDSEDEVNRNEGSEDFKRKKYDEGKNKRANYVKNNDESG